MQISANVGEWSELYVLLRLLTDQKLYTITQDLSKNEKLYLPILRILRDETENAHIEYKCNSNGFIQLYFNEKFIHGIDTETLNGFANYIFKSIASERNRNAKGAFTINKADEIMNKLQCQKLKASSAEKADITMEIHDPFTNYNRICGFSIKSDIGEPPTLFNASQSTNFKFEVTGLTSSQILKINSIETKGKVKARVRQIPNLTFVSTSNQTFHQNLIFVDTQMDKFLAEMIKIYYQENITDCAELSDIVDKRDPLKLETENIYPHKLKKFLCAVALGLRPTKKWNGLDEANGGYIIVKTNGEVVAYHLYNRNSFENYLLNNTKFDTPSVTRHRFGKIYSENGKNFINLNFQIRFK